jgi:2-haloacid dehalogenase
MYVRATPVLVFDVNETLLDLGALDPLFARVCGEATARREWFDAVLRCAFVGEVVGETGAFARCGAAALEAVCTARGVAVTREAAADVGVALRSLPPHPEVRGALEQLRDSGYAIAALTNNAAEVVEAQFANAGIRDLFDHVLSADASGHLKPHRAVYETAIAALGHPAPALRMVAAHDWDLRGAMAVGMAGAFVHRPGQTWNPLYPRPDVWGADLAEVAAQLVGG